ncbi:MFS transporter [Neptunicella marina]|uniref:MFS transporter n=1 Tax=Neptunicella marina TaxID=2125989 RepID=A0A8J6M4G3_9ALTE|nr:MFS transporter [Neptunicella marina]MBC3766086.1 MFS transporter [Neptunicella marina]
MNKLEIKAAISLASIYVLRMLGLFMVMPVLAVLGKSFDDYSPFLVGLAIGGYGLTQAVLQIPMGTLSDRVGRKPVIIGGLMMFVIGSWVAGSADSLTGVVIGRFLQGAGAIAGAVMALAGDVSRDTQRSKMMAIIGISIGFSFYLAVILGPIITSAFGLSGIFYITAILGTLAIPLVKFVVPDAINLAPSRDTLPLIADVKKVLKQGQLMRLNVSVLLLHMLITLLFTQLPGLISKAGWPLEKHWELYLPILILSIAGLGLLMRLSKHLSPARPMQLAIGLLILAFAGFIWMDLSLHILLMLGLLFFIGFNFLEANLPALVSGIAPAGKKGSAMGIYASFQFFGAFLGGTLAGAITQELGGQLVFALALAICIAWLPILSGFNGNNHLKRYTLALDLQHCSAQELAQKLTALSGVKDVTIILEEQTAYLKVEDQHFNLQQAREIAGQSS